jgi:hypothetical protein
MIWHSSSGIMSHMFDMYQEITVLRVDQQSKVSNNKKDEVKNKICGV